VGPLLDCTSESRRRAQAGDQLSVRGAAADVTAARAVKGPATERSATQPRGAPSSYAYACALVAAAVAWAWASPRFSSLSSRAVFAAGAALAALVAWRRLCDDADQRASLKTATTEHDAGTTTTTSPRGGHTTSFSGLCECWASSERAPPLPLLELPPTHEDVVEPWMRAAGVAPRWNARERKFLARCRREYRAAFAAAPPYLDAYGDRRLLRFLRQDPQPDEDRAVAKVGAYLEWRQRTDADAARAKLETILQREAETAARHDPRQWPHGDVLLECIRLVQCSERYFDRSGNAVTVYQAFHWPAPDLRKQVGGMSARQLVDFATFGAEYNQVMMERISISREKVLLDHARSLYEAWGTSSPSSSSATKVAVSGGPAGATDAGTTTNPGAKNGAVKHDDQPLADDGAAAEMTRLQHAARSAPASLAASSRRVRSAGNLSVSSAVDEATAATSGGGRHASLSPSSLSHKTAANPDRGGHQGLPGTNDAATWHQNRTPVVREGWGELTRLCAITDMSGCTFGSMAMPQLIPAVIQAVSIFVNQYPFIVGELHVINCASIVAKIFKRALHTVVPKHIADQVQIHVHARELLDSVRLPHLPTQIGGAAECPELEPPPGPPSTRRGTTNGGAGPPGGSAAAASPAAEKRRSPATEDGRVGPDEDNDRDDHPAARRGGMDATVLTGSGASTSLMSEEVPRELPVGVA